MKPLFAVVSAVAGLATAFVPRAADACACGCDVFAVADPSMLPSAGELRLFGEFDYLDQTENWSGSSSAPAADNPDKQLKSLFYTFDAEAMVAPNWAVMVEVPVVDRTFRTIPDGETAVQTFHDTAVGDVRLTATYTGLSKDESTGLIVGIKLPTGPFDAPGFDRDTQIGSGSTNLLLAAFHRGSLTVDGRWGWAVQGVFNQPFISQGGYTPGREADASAGVTWQAWRAGGGHLIVAPVLQIIGSARARDSGPQADPEATGYRRFILAPGVQLSAGRWSLYGDVEIPIAQSFNGNQLVAPVFFKAILSRSF